MNEVLVRTPDVIAVEIRSIDSHARSVLLVSCLEIGQRLVEAKSLLPHGEWGGWLKNSVNYSQSTANNLMQLYREYGDGSKFPTLGNLSYTKAIALLGVPEEDREDFVKVNDIENKSARQIQQLIRERDQALEESKQLNSKLKTTEDTVETITVECDTLRKEKKVLQNTLRDERKSAQSNVDRLTKMLNEAKDGDDCDRVKELEGELQEAQEQVSKLTEQINQPVTLEPAVVEKVPDDVGRELEELRQKAQEYENLSKQKDSAAIHKYSIYFEALVLGFKNLLGALAEINDTDPAEHERYRGAVIALIGKMSDKL